MDKDKKRKAASVHQKLLNRACSSLRNAKIYLQIDIGFDDVVTPDTI